MLSEEIVAFDIDNNKIFKKEELVSFPVPFTKSMIKSLEIQL